jgi:hypothetical protein
MPSINGRQCHDSCLGTADSASRWSTVELEALVARKNHSDHARVTAICVNLALDAVEDEIRREIEMSDATAVAALERILAKVKRRRITGDEIGVAGSC